MPEARSVNYVFPLLEEHNRSTCALLASRAAFRSLPFVANLDRKGYERQILYCFRALLIAFLGPHGAKIPPVEFESISSSAAKRVDEMAFEVAPDHYALRSAALACICSMGNVDAADVTANAVYNSSLAMAQNPLSPSELAYLAFDKDLLRPKEHTRLWHDLELTGTLQATHSNFVRIINDKKGPWKWWRAWYEQIWHGTFTDWDFALEVAKIDWDAPEGESVWDEGPAAVAARIEDLERKRNGEPHFDETRVKDRVKELLKNSNAAASMAESAASLIFKGIVDYKREAPANGLPEGLELLEELPVHFSQIAEALRKDGPQAAREEELEAEIKRLNAKIGKLEAEAAKHRALGAVFREEWVRGMAKTLSDKWFLGGMCFSTAYFFGVDVSDFTLENLRGYISELMEAERADQKPGSQPKPLDV